MMIVIIIIGSILFIIPGIIASLMFSQVFYIIAEDNKIDPYNALVKSKKMMEGNKWKLFKIMANNIIISNRLYSYFRNWFYLVGTISKCRIC